MMKRMLAALLFLCLTAGMCACSATETPVGYDTILDSVGLSNLPHPEKAAAYRAENWQPQEEPLREALFQSEEFERVVEAPGPAYYAYSPASSRRREDLVEALAYRDGGRAFSGTDAAWVGFSYGSYGYGQERSFVDARSLLGDFMSSPAKLSALQEHSDESDLPFCSGYEALEQVERLFETIGMPALELCFSGAFSAEQLNALKKISSLMEDAPDFDAGFGCYLFRFRQPVDEILTTWGESSFVSEGQNPIHPERITNPGYTAGGVTVIVSRDGNVSLESGQIALPGEKLAEYDMLSALDCFHSVEELCDELFPAEVRLELVFAEFGYVTLKDEKGYFYQLQPSWHFTIKREIHGKDTSGEEFVSVDYIAFQVNAATGKIIEYDDTLKVPGT